MCTEDHGEKKLVALDAQITHRPDHVVGVSAAGLGVVGSVHPTKNRIRQKAL